MAVNVTIECEGVTEKEYDAINKELGLDMDTGHGDWPKGLRSHTAGMHEKGHLVVIEVWDTRQHQEEFMESKLGALMAKFNVQPSSITWHDVLSHHAIQKDPVPRSKK